MKKLLLPLMVLCGAISVTAQTEPGVVVPIDNATRCNFFVTLTAFDPSNCTSHNVTILVPAGSSAIAPTLPGLQYEFAVVADSFGGIPTYMEQIQTPNGSATYPGTGLPACLPNNTAMSCETDNGCSGLVTVCWTGDQSIPHITITY